MNEEVRMRRRRAFVTLAVSGSLLVGVARPAEASAYLVQKKTISGPHGRSGKVLRYVDQKDGDEWHYLRIVADDADGKRGKCTETWIDFATKPHQHFNPGLLVNCSGKSRRVSKAFLTRYEGIAGVQIVVCEVPDSPGRIVRNRANCRGNLSGIYLRSGRRYRDFQVGAIQWPSGVKIWRV
jgi:hypothetical protein